MQKVVRQVEMLNRSVIGRELVLLMKSIVEGFLSMQPGWAFE
jgi:hypothetical protein